MIEGLLNNLGVGVLFIDTEHRIRWANRTAQEWFGPLEIGVKRRCYRTMEYSDTFCMICPTGRTIDLGNPTRYEFTIPRKGKSRIYEIIGLPTFDEAGGISGVMELVLDITENGIEKKKVDELMIQIEKMAAIGQLAAGVAHEMNNPLATISIISQELNSVLEDGNTSRDELREYLVDMEGEIKRCKAIIGDLLQFSSRRGITEPIETDINPLVSKTVDLLKKGGIPDNCHISCNLAPELPMVKTDPERFRQVVFNILKNAIEAVEDRQDGRVVISTGVDSGFIIVNVTDNGHGISKDNLKRVFEPFFTTKPVGKGTGLGLSVSYGIMKGLKGEIGIESIVGKGTRVSLSLPLS